MDEIRFYDFVASRDRAGHFTSAMGIDLYTLLGVSACAASLLIMKIHTSYEVYEA